MQDALPVAGALVALIVLVALIARARRAGDSIPPAPRSNADVLRDVGIAGIAKVIFMQPTGNVVGASKEFHVTVEVRPEFGRPYRVNLVSVVAPAEEHRVRIGHQIPIRIDPKKRTDVVIDLASA